MFATLTLKSRRETKTYKDKLRWKSENLYEKIFSDKKQDAEDAAKDHDPSEDENLGGNIKCYLIEAIFVKTYGCDHQLNEKSYEGSKRMRDSQNLP